MRPFLAPISSQAVTFWCCGPDYDDNQKARKDSLISHGWLAFCTATKILLAFISRAASSTDTTSRKSAIEEKMFWKVTISRSKYLHDERHFLPTLMKPRDGGWCVWSWHNIQRSNLQLYLVFCFLGCVVKFQASEANSWRRSASSNPGNRVCVLFLFLSFLYFSFLLLAFFLLQFYLSK